MDIVKEQTINIESIEVLMALFGSFDENIKYIEEETNVHVIARETEIKVIGQQDDVELAVSVINKLVNMIKNKETIDRSKIGYTLQLVKAGKGDAVEELSNDIVCVTYNGKQIKCKTLGQKRYVKAMSRNDVVFGIGPAGTGKTYLAMAMAVTAYRNKKVSRIILTRPAVEAGEKLGFLPGDLQNKVDPYLRPLYDALYDIMGPETYQKLIERGVIEVAPLAYMRGRTLEDSYIILDEAQNTTSEQMKMFLTRLGQGSKAVITGDITQIDLPSGKSSGLKEVSKILQNVKGLEFVYLTNKDVVRHPLVMRIIEAYERYESKKEDKRPKTTSVRPVKKF